MILLLIVFALVGPGRGRYVFSFEAGLQSLSQWVPRNIHIEPDKKLNNENARK